MITSGRGYPSLGVLALYFGRREVDERMRKARELETLERIAAELARLRILKEHELGVRVENDAGTLNIKSVKKK